jgi:hypothetical protein
MTNEEIAAKNKREDALMEAGLAELDAMLLRLL